jgi:acyl-coenzyme A thioesterase PaaI-like protein
MMPAKSIQPLNSLVDHFISIPWCAKMLQEPGAVPFVPPSRQDPEQLAPGSLRSQDQLFKHQLDNEEAVPWFIGFYHDLGLGSASEHPNLPFLVTSASLLLDLRPGVNGFNGTVHGGLIAAMMDEAMGTFLFQNDTLNRKAKAKGLIPQTAKDFASFGYVTVRMDVSYHKPISTPSIVVVTAALDRVEGKKTYIRVVVRGERGESYASCNSLWISFPRGKL